MSGPVVVGILSHRDPPLVRRLVARVLEGRNTVAVVHHDPRGPDLDLPRSDRIFLVPNPQHCDWGRIEFAQAMLRVVEFAHRHVPDLSWTLLVSGQDYPCRALPSIEDELASTSHDVFLRFFRVDQESHLDVHHWQAVCRRRYLHRLKLPATHRSVPFPRRSPFAGARRPHELHLYAGDTWVNLSAAAVDHVLDQRRALRRVERYLARCSNPDEALLPTLLLNNAEHLDTVNDRRRFIRWTPGESHPAFLTAPDARAALASTDFFARKCDSVQTAAALEVFDEQVSSGKPAPGQQEPT